MSRGRSGPSQRQRPAPLARDSRRCPGRRARRPRDPCARHRLAAGRRAPPSPPSVSTGDGRARPLDGPPPRAHRPGVLDELGGVARDHTAQLLVAGRLSAAALRRLETRDGLPGPGARRGARPSRRRCRGPGHPGVGHRDAARSGRRGCALGDFIGRLADGALIDTRVLLAHRHGPDEAAWPSAEDRFASDLLLPARVQRSMAAATDAPRVPPHPLPIALGGHTLVGPGLGLALGLESADGRWTSAATRLRASLDVGSEPALVERIRAEILARAARSPLPGSWSWRCTNRALGTTGDRRRARAAPATSSRRPRPTRSSVGPSPASSTRSGSAGPARAIRGPRARGRNGHAGEGNSRRARRDGSPLLDAIRYQPVEVEAARLVAFEARLAAAGHATRVDTGAGGPLTGVVLANEVLDALPVHRVRRRGWPPGAVRRLGRRALHRGPGRAIDARDRSPPR